MSNATSNVSLDETALAHVSNLQRSPDPSPADALTVALCVAEVDAPASLGLRLRHRVTAQRAASAALHTLRRPLSGHPQHLAGGVRIWPLTAGRSWRVHLPPESVLPLTDATHELLVLEGALQLGDESLPQFGHAVAGAGAAWQAGAQGARVYLRQHAAGPFSAPIVPHLTHPNDSAWQPLRLGVSLYPLYGESGAVSLLARFESDACVPAHPHGIDEECLMLDGDLFLGDTLLRPGGFQSAPAGSQHGDLVADSPCLLFFHGALDPAAVDNLYRAARGWPAL